MAELQVERTHGVVTVTLNRPSRKNALHGPLIDHLIRTLAEIADDPANRAMVLSGAGEAFCSGLDLGEPVAPDELAFMRRVGRLVTSLHQLPIPTIAHVMGPAMGLGCNLALACDLVVAGDSATFGETFAARGLSVDGGGSWLLPRSVGLAKAKELAFFAQQLSGHDAERAGLVNRVVPDSELHSVVTEWAQRLADGPTQALSKIKTTLNTAFESPFAQVLEAEILAQAHSFHSEEATEGMRAFSQRQRPRFRADAPSTETPS